MNGYPYPDFSIEDGDCSSYGVTLKHYKVEIDDLVYAKAIAVPHQKSIFVFTYPLSKKVEVECTSKTEKGFTVEDVVEIVGSTYERIYKEENESSGKYGIWGHGLNDLLFHSIKVKEENSIFYVYLGIDS